jgi:NitT/TauT family transport system ATP-binding protein
MARVGYPGQYKQIEIKNLSKTYFAKDGEIQALKDISIEVNKGEFVSVVGPSGCGKTTLIKTIAGLLPKTQGVVRVNNIPVREPLADVGFVFQMPVLFPWRKALDNVMLPVEILNLDSNRFGRKAIELFQLVGLEGFEQKYPYELSGGMQQRVAICRALIHNPSLLIMDEPFSALDAISREKMNSELLRIWSSEKKTVLFVTHNIGEAVFLSDRVYVLSPRPATIVEVVSIDLPRPRKHSIKDSLEYIHYVSEIRGKVGITD